MMNQSSALILLKSIRQPDELLITVVIIQADYVNRIPSFINSVNQSMLFIYSPRVKPCQISFQHFRFACAIMRMTH